MGGSKEEIPSDDSELIRSALRLSGRVWAKLERQSRHVSEAEVLRDYIRLCPYVTPNGPAMQAAIDGLTQFGTKPEALPVDSSPEPSDDDSEGKETSVVVEEEEEVTVKERTTIVNQSMPKPSGLRQAARILFVDFPVLILLFACAAFAWVEHVHDEYLKLQLEAAVFSGARAESEITYYKRPCTGEDMTTSNGADLFLPLDVTPKEAYEHQLLHGFSVFRNVVSEEAASELRTFITSRNRNLTDEESIFVIANTNRFSFGLGTEEPSVVRVMNEIATNDRLQPALEEILGPNPALIEMTAITSSYGAIAQYWHDDVIPTGSAINYARSFGPSYSVFVQLQNTTKQMGATDACPGTHYCSDGDIKHFCQARGFQLVNEKGHWGVGDALLMNMNSYHRGAAHTDKNALDRVMLILTFVPRPVERAESRQMSQGITFSLRWDMWGHTLYDLSAASKYMDNPWATIRAFGLFNKVSKSTWGVDLVSSATMRMANGDNGYRRDELDDFLERGGFWWLPDSLQGKVDDHESWYEFYLSTFLLCKDFTFKACCAAIAFGLFFSLFSRSSSVVGSVLFTGVRLSLFAGLAFVTFKVAQMHVDGTGWAKDIKANRRYGSTVPAEILFSPAMDWPTTFPTKYDVLVETRYGSRQLNMYNDFINGHPGNRMFRTLLPSPTKVFLEYPYELQEATAAYIVGQMKLEHGRFLYQAPNGAWLLMDDEEAVDYVKKELAKQATPLNTYMSKELRFLFSDLKYGILRHTSMAILDLAPFVDLLTEKLVPGVKEEPKQANRSREGERSSAAVASPFPPTFVIPSAPKYVPPTRWNTRPFPHEEAEGIEPFAGAWLKEGDTVDGLADERYYMGTITHVSAHGGYFVSYPDGDENENDPYTIRPFEPYHEGEEVEVLHDGAYERCEIVAVMEDGTYHAHTHSGDYLTNLEDLHFRRRVHHRRQRSTYQSAY